MTRRAAGVLASHQYRSAEVYGLKSAPNGPATTSVLLGALPVQDRPGASLFQLSTHEIVATLNLVPSDRLGDGQAHELRPPPAGG